MNKHIETAVVLATKDAPGTAPALLPKPTDYFTCGAIAKPPEVAKDPTKEQKTFITCPYVGHRSTAGDGKNEDRAGELDAAGIPCPGYYLFAGEPIHLVPFQFHILRTEWFFTKQNPQGQLVGARLHDSLEGREAGYYKHLYVILAVVLPQKDTPSKFIAALGNFRSAQTAAFDYKFTPAMSKALDPNTAALTPAHAEAAKAKLAGGRFRCTIWSAEEKVDNGLMIKSYGRTNVTPAADVPAFNSWFEAGVQPGGELTVAMAAFEKKLEEPRKLVSGGVVKQVK